jgi:hypothetical protein
MRAILGQLGVWIMIGAFSAPLLAATPKKDDPEMLDDIVVEVRIPKPEANIFTPKRKTRYETIPYEKSFLGDILESVDKGPF